jgi:hypothetical protein
MMPETGYIDRIKTIKASVAIFIITFLTYQSSPYLFGANWIQYQDTVRYYFLFTTAAWVMFYARTPQKIPTNGAWYPLRRIGIIEFSLDFLRWSALAIAALVMLKFIAGLPLIGNPEGITLYALFDYSLIVAIHENLLWLVMLPPYLAIAAWTTTPGRMLNSLPVSCIAAVGHVPKIYGSLAAVSEENLFIPVSLSLLIIFGMFVFMFWITHTYGFAAGVAVHAWWDILI